MIGSCRTILLLAFLMTLFAGSASAAIQLIYPAERSFVHRSDYIILKTNDSSISGVRLTINGVDSDILQISSTEYRKLFGDMLIVQPVWDKGKNQLLVEGFSGDKKVQSIATEIFFNQSDDRSQIPKDFIESPFHVPEKEKICAPCHLMSSSVEKGASQDPKKSPCALCHTKLVTVKIPHEPALNFSCTHCHSKVDTPRYGVPGSNSAFCAECHADKIDQIKKNSFPHGLVAAGYCMVCHDPHGSENPGSLKAPINEVCLSCHQKIAKEPHVARNNLGKGHPLSGKNDLSPNRRGKELSCVSCHDPHGGVVRYFFVSRKEERMALCQFCHAK